MTLRELKTLLAENPARELLLELPSTEFVPEHFHVTEVGLVRKDFIDCGGSRRSLDYCSLQAWVAHDLDHRMTTDKLGKILSLSGSVLPDDRVTVEVEYEAPYISQFPLIDIGVNAEVMIWRLGVKHTACLAPDKCGVTPITTCCDVKSGCC